MSGAQAVAQDTEKGSSDWLESLLSPAPAQPPSSPAPAVSSQTQVKPVNSTDFVPPARVASTAEWKTLLVNVRELRPQFLGALQAIHRHGAALVKGEHRYFLARGNMPEDAFEHIISTLYFHVINKELGGVNGEPAPHTVGEILWELRRRGARLKESGDIGLTLSRGSISPGDWEIIKREQLQPNREEILRLQRVAREEVSFVMSLSRLAKVTGEKNVEWKDL